jgi:hypothetical protein
MEGNGFMDGPYRGQIPLTQPRPLQLQHSAERVHVPPGSVHDTQMPLVQTPEMHSVSDAHVWPPKYAQKPLAHPPED